MLSALSLLATAVLGTAELCATPVEGGAGDPPFCRMENSRRIETPFFSVVVEARLLVGVDREGRRLRVQPAPLDDAAHLTIEVLEGVDLPAWPDCSRVTETVENIVTWRDCHVASGGVFERRLAARLRNHSVMIRYRYSSQATVLAPALERMAQSVRIQAN